MMKSSWITKLLLIFTLAFGWLMQAGCGTPDIARLEERKDVERLIRALDDEDPVVVIDAVGALGRIGDPASIEPLYIKTYNTEDQSVTLAAIVALGKFDDPEAVTHLIHMLRVEDQDMREAATIALAHIGASAVEPLVSVLRDSVPDRKGDGLQVEGIVDALFQMGEESVEPLLGAIQEGNGYSREKLADVLDAAGWQPSMDEAGAYYWIAKREWEKCAGIGALALEPLITILTDENMATREMAAYAIGLIGDARAVEPLITVLSSSNDWELRTASVEALGRIGSERAVEPLLDILYEDSTELREPVVAALGQIGEPLLSELGSTLNALMSVCRPPHDSGMESLDGGVPNTFYPLVVLDSEGQVNQWTSVFLHKYEPDSSGNALLVACIGQSYIPVKTCWYMGAGVIDRYRQKTEIVLRQAATGVEVARTVLYEEPEDCPLTRKLDAPSYKWYAAVDFMDMDAWLSEYVP